MQSRAAGLVIVVALAGCSASVVVTGGKASHPDPMGVNEFTGPDGTVGWYETYDDAEQRYERLLEGLLLLRCDTRYETIEQDELAHAQCRELPALVARLNEGKTLYRVCAPGTDRVDCRSAREKVHDKTPYRR